MSQEIKIKFRVIDKISGKDITNDKTWVVTPDGKLYFLEYDLIGYPNAITVECTQPCYPRCSKCANEMICCCKMDSDGKCPNYIRDAKDGGSY